MRTISFEGRTIQVPDDATDDEIKGILSPAPSQPSQPGAVPSLGGALVQAGQNVGPSANQFLSDMTQAVAHPINTAENVGNVALGAAEKLVPGTQAHEKYADVLGKFFADRYGGWDNFKKTLAKDPVGVAADLSTILSGGELAMARAPGLLGEAGRAVGTVGRAVDPINATMKVGQLTGSKIAVPLAATSAGVTTGAGGAAVKTAMEAGYQGGEAADAFRNSMRGSTPLAEPVADARSALANVKEQRGNAYRSGMADVSLDKTVLDFGKIDGTLAGAPLIKEFKGISISPSVKATVDEISGVLNQWRNLDPAEYHTPEGFDALKQRLGDIVDSTPYGSPQRKVATRAVNVVRDQIVQQAPHYAKVMQQYAQASDLIREIEGTLSLNPNARVDTTLRKLQSVLRNNVNTTYGQRVKLAELLQQNGATNLMQKLAGQSLNSLEPRGLARAVAGAGGIAAVLHPNPLLLGSLALASPRLVGEGAYYGGKAANALSYLPITGAARLGYQANRGQ